MKTQEYLDFLDFGEKNSKDVLKLMFLIIFAIAMGLYIGDLLFGNNSIEILFRVKNKKEILKREIKRLKEENAKLQKDYFELKELEP
jgi:cell division protein FtsB